MNNVGVIVLGGQVPGYGMLRILDKNNIPSVVIHSSSFGITRYSKYCKAYYQCDYNNTVDFLRNLGEIGKYTKWLLIPTDDFYVILLSKNKDELSNYFIVTVDKWEVVEKFINKKYAYPLAQSVGIPIPETYYPQSEMDLQSIMNIIKYPCIVKPSIEQGFLKEFKNKVFLCINKSELIEYYKRALNVIDPGNILIQEIIPGSSENQYSVGIFYNRDKSYNYIVLRRKRQNPADFGKSATYTETVYQPALINYAEKILNEVKFFGVCEVEFKYDRRDDKFKFLEVNARFWRSHYLSEGAGIPLLMSLYRYFTSGFPIINKDYKDCGFKDDIRDVPAIFNMIRNNEFIKSDKNKVVHAVFNLRDIMPFIIQLLSISYFKIKHFIIK